jgi:ribonuclease-3
LSTRRKTAAHSQPKPAQSSAVPLSRPAGGPSDPPGEDFFGYSFRNPSLLSLALTHSSLAYESNPEGVRDPGADNEQLEFIGDAVLGLVVAEALFRRFPTSREGELTRMRASLVSSRNLAQVAQRIDLGPMLRLGRGEENSGGKSKPALLANALEAVIAAIYLDGGLTPAGDFVHRYVIDPAQATLFNVLRSDEPFSGAIGDYKSALQERLQATGAGQPRYIVTDQSGPDHQKRFRIEVRIAAPDTDADAITLASAEGTTKKQAQQEAARLAFISLFSQSGPKLSSGPGSTPSSAPGPKLSSAPGSKLSFRPEAAHLAAAAEKPATHPADISIVEGAQ